MNYFSNFPKILTTDYNGNSILLTNIMNRVEIIPTLLKNPLLFYHYDIQDSDRPDIVADKYYNDSYLYWLVLFANEIVNPKKQWPLTSQQFEPHIIEKYSQAAGGSNVLAYMQSTIYEYRKIITTIDGNSLTSTTRTVVIDESTFNSTIEGTTTQTFPAGYTVSQTIKVRPVSIYDYEVEQNELKRNINIVNKKYADDFQTQLRSLLGQ
jgi:hypothetical protein